MENVDEASLIRKIQERCRALSEASNSRTKDLHQRSLKGHVDTLLMLYEDRIMRFVRFGVKRDRRPSQWLAILKARQGDQGQEEDLCQEVALKLYKSICQFKEGQNPWPWIKRIVTSVVQDALKRDAQAIERQSYEALRRDVAKNLEAVLDEASLDLQGQRETMLRRLRLDLEQKTYRQFQQLTYDCPLAKAGLKAVQAALKRSCVPLLVRHISLDSALGRADKLLNPVAEDDSPEFLVWQQGLAVKVLQTAFELCKPHQALVYFWAVLGYKPREIVRLFFPLTLFQLAEQLQGQGSHRFVLWVSEFQEACSHLTAKLNQPYADFAALGQMQLGDFFGKDPHGDVQNWVRRARGKIRRRLLRDHPEWFVNRTPT